MDRTDSGGAHHVLRLHVRRCPLAVAEHARKHPSWSPTIFGLYGGSEFILNVCGFLLVAGIILDKMGVRFTGILSASLMVLGAGIKFYGLEQLLL